MFLPVVFNVFGMSSIHGAWHIFSEILDSGVRVVWHGFVSCKGSVGEGRVQFSCLLSVLRDLEWLFSHRVVDMSSSNNRLGIDISSNVCVRL